MQWDPGSALHDVEEDRVEGPSAAYASLLSKCPVAHIDGPTVGYWGVFAYDELTEAALDTKSFSNVTALHGPRIVPLQSDPPEHTAYRRMLNQFFSPDVIDRVERKCRAYAGEMIDAFISAGTADFATDFAYPFPTRVLCTFFGVPHDDWRIHHDWVMEMERVTGDGLTAPAEGFPEARCRRSCRTSSA